MKVLSENCEFKCTGNQSIKITASEQENTVMRAGGEKILTDKAKCKIDIPLTCSFLTAAAGGTPVNCQLLQTKWINPSDNIKCNGNKVLTDKSFISCINGGLILPIISDCVVNVASVAGVNDINEEIKVSGEMLNHKLNEDRESHSSDINQNKELSCNMKSSIENSDDEDKIYQMYALCDYENCSEREECKYFKSEIYVENNSLLLKSNFQSNRNDEWKKYYLLHKNKNLESKNGGWRIAAHHIIPGNQVLMMKDSEGRLLYGAIIKLANFFGYDVNNEWNCVMLPTNEAGFGELEQTIKRAVPYEAMSLIGRQWHAGSHEYKLDKETLCNIYEYYKKNPEQYSTLRSPNFFVNYKQAIKEEMDLLLEKYSKCLCWKKNYDSRRKKFINDMNSLSAKVERYLLNFNPDPKKSFPFFVSKVSVEYAYNLPATAKLVVIYKRNNKLKAKRIRLERYVKNGSKIVPIEKDEIELIDDKKFILFCENIMHFYVASELTDFSFPFAKTALNDIAVKRVNFAHIDVMKYLLENSKEILDFINQNEYAYQSIAKVINERGGC